MATKNGFPQEKVARVINSASRERFQISQQTREQFERAFKTIKTGDEAVKAAREKNYLGGKR